jgi:hypothetical protein
MARERKFKNPWAKGGEYYPDYLGEEDVLVNKSESYNYNIVVPKDENTKHLSALIYAEADDQPFKDKKQTNATEEMLAIGSVIKNRIEWVKNKPSDKDSFCGETYLQVISCINKWKQSQFLSYNNSKYKQLINNKIPNEIQQRFANACIEAAKRIIQITPTEYKTFLGFNKSASQSPFSEERTKEPPTKIGKHYFWELKK